MFDVGALVLVLCGFVAACGLALAALLQAGREIALVPAQVAMIALGALGRLSLPALLAVSVLFGALSAALVAAVIPAVSSWRRARGAERR